MDQLFGDATTAMPTPAQHAEIDSLMGGRSPVPSLDIRNGALGRFDADSAIPGLDINPPAVSIENGKPHLPIDDQVVSRKEGIGGWISKMVNRGKKEGKGSTGDAGMYRQLDQSDN